MTPKVFVITLFLVIALFGIASSPMTHLGVNDSYYYEEAAQAVAAKCGPDAKLFDLLVAEGVNGYAFTHGTCGSGSANEFVRVYYDFKMHSVGSPEVTVNGGDYYDFPRHIAQPISLSDWKISSGQAFEIVSRQKEFEQSDFSLLQGQLELYISGDTLVWDYSNEDSRGQLKIIINATTGRVISSGGQPIYPN